MTIKDTTNDLFLSGPTDVCAAATVSGIAEADLNDYSTWEMEIYEDLYWYMDDFESEYSYMDFDYVYEEAYFMYTAEWGDCEDPAESLATNADCTAVVLMTWMDTMEMADFAPLKWTFAPSATEGMYMLLNGNTVCAADTFLGIAAGGALTHDYAAEAAGAVFDIPEYFSIVDMDEMGSFFDEALNTAAYIGLFVIDVVFCFIDYVTAADNRSHDSFFTCINDIKNKYACPNDAAIEDAIAAEGVVA